MTRRRMHLVAFLKTGPTFHHHGAWRHPEATLHDMLKPERYEHIGRVLEEGFFDACFFEDLSGVYDIHAGSFETMLGRGGQLNLLDPLMVLPYVARATTHLGLGITLSTTFYHPFHLARMLASLDHLTGGRIAWNVVTSITDLEARNFGLPKMPDRETRYERAEESVDACMALWDTWQEGALILDKQAGRFADPSKVRYADYRGKHVASRGPLPTPRSPQGHPVIMQAGQSPSGRALAARVAEVIFTFQYDTQAMIGFRADMHERMRAIGRDPADCAILPCLDIILGETESVAREKQELLDSLLDPELAMAITSCHLSVDLSQFDPDTPVHDIASLAAFQGAIDIMTQGASAKGGMTLREAAMRYGTSVMAPQVVGT
ncbi:MAG: NtaA/DmoA family FMN-dependent monooxygenase, partial [Proteobacteria bacterium]|nr:NtaA/DmoA family FMN-dependent monooxygenase [Pseudomonadota bacterium]